MRTDFDGEGLTFDQFVDRYGIDLGPCWWQASVAIDRLTQRSQTHYVPLLQLQDYIDYYGALRGEDRWLAAEKFRTTVTGLLTAPLYAPCTHERPETRHSGVGQPERVSQVPPRTERHLGTPAAGRSRAALGMTSPGVVSTYEYGSDDDVLAPRVGHDAHRGSGDMFLQAMQVDVRDVHVHGDVHFHGDNAGALGGDEQGYVSDVVDQHDLDQDDDYASESVGDDDYEQGDDADSYYSGDENDAGDLDD